MNKTQQCLFSMLLLVVSPLSLAKETPDWNYVMQPGESIWSIAHELLTDWRHWQALESYNNVRNDRQMPPGTVLRIPRNLISEQASDIRVVNVSGTVTAEVDLEHGARAHLPLLRGRNLRPGDRIRTAAQSSVLLEFADGTQVLILESSLLRVEQASVMGQQRKVVDIQVFLESGEAEIRANPKKLPGSRFLIDTPAAFATTKGTQYRVRAEAERTAAEVTQGLIGVTNSRGDTRVAAGYGTLARADEAPRPPAKLLPAPGLENIQQPLRYLPEQIRWAALPEATGYRVQISPDPEFSALVVDQSVTRAQFNLPVRLQDQPYWLRVSGISSEGLQGFAQVQKIVIDARPFPPLQQTPVQGASLYVGAVDFSWSQPELAASYHLEIARDEGFTDRVRLEQGIRAAQWQETITRPGVYFWRVNSVTASGEEGPSGVIGQFNVMALPPTPELQQPVIDQEQLTLRWREEPGVARYQLQLAGEPEFANPELDQITTDSALSVVRPASGNYYLRVRGVYEDGVSGGWSEPQQVVVPVESWWPLAIPASTLLLLLL
ncbi:FecR domain-containing protein [Neptuniibacter halophilus]|uniref:FecR domain-containing protein n=1 Tax=Neptuniibacter halophilus TaxID=651666 RepID=UPI00257241BE|nr:FecR domain-containing protein [Neptuniibacter halophilus]